MAATKAALVDFIREEQARLWEDLLRAICQAIRPGTISIQAEGVIDSLRQSIALVGATAWDEINWDLYSSGVYGLVAGEAATHPDPGVLGAVEQRMAPYSTAERLRVCRDVAARLAERPAVS